MTELAIAKDLHLPVDAVTQTFLIVGKRGSGKSNTAARFVEQLHGARIPFVVLDPTDTWWGLKASRDGGPGLAGVYVFGGRKADLPLEGTGGVLIAESLCEHRLSMVLSVKHLSGRARSTFMVDFAQTLFQKWNGGPLHVVLEEAHELAPQSAMNAKEGEQQMLGAFKRLWKLGRSSGIGGSAITQRPASLSKDITTQSEILIAHRTIGPQDVKAIGEWVKYHGEREDILADLPTLPSGEAFVWAPEFPEGKPIGLRRTKILLRDTYDSASTPKVGEHRVEPKELAPADIEQLRAKMAATIERAKSEDPKALRAEVARLKRELEAKPKTNGHAAKPVDREQAQRLVDVGVRKATEALNRDQRQFRQGLKREIDRLQRQFEPIGTTIAALSSAVAAEFTAPAGWAPAIVAPQGRSSREVPRENARSTARTANPEQRGVVSAPSAGSGASLGKGERTVLRAIAQYPDGAERDQLTVLTGYKRSTRDAYIQRLCVAGYVAIDREYRVVATDAGIDALGSDFEPLPQGDELQRYWLNRLPEGERRILEPLLSAYPDAVRRDVLEEQTGYKRSTRDAYLQRLQSRRLVEDVGRGEVRASANLFSEGLA